MTTHPIYRPPTCLAVPAPSAAPPRAGGRGCKKAEPTEEVVAPVRVAPAIKGSIRLIVNADAVLYPRDQANIVPKISAPVRRFLVNRGDHVKQGQLLAELESARSRRRGAGEPRPVRAGAVELPIDDRPPACPSR